MGKPEEKPGEKPKNAPVETPKSEGFPSKFKKWATKAMPWLIVIGVVVMCAGFLAAPLVSAGMQAVMYGVAIGGAASCVTGIVGTDVATMTDNAVSNLISAEKKATKDLKKKKDLAKKAEKNITKLYERANKTLIDKNNNKINPKDIKRNYKSFNNSINEHKAMLEKHPEIEEYSPGFTKHLQDTEAFVSQLNPDFTATPPEVTPLSDTTPPITPDDYTSDQTPPVTEKDKFVTALENVKNMDDGDKKNMEERLDNQIKTLETVDGISKDNLNNLKDKLVAYQTDNNDFESLAQAMLLASELGKEANSSIEL